MNKVMKIIIIIIIIMKWNNNVMNKIMKIMKNKLKIK